MPDANPAPPTPPAARFPWLSRNTLGLVLLLGAFALSLFQIFWKERQVAESGKTVLRICHWQLELGYRQALQKVIDEYEKLHDDKVKVIQMPITEKVYLQWVNTHLISGEAPDLIEMGQARLTKDDTYCARFFLPLADYVLQPNPYNQGTDLEGVPWRQTLIDSMRGGYKESLQDYYQVPTSTSCYRLFYNKGILRQLRQLGYSGQAPTTFGQWMEACRKVKELSAKSGKRIIPILSNYPFHLFYEQYNTAFLATMEGPADLDLNGEITYIESYELFGRGLLSMKHPRLRAFYECLKEIAEQMPPGFNSMDRQTAQYFFVQGQGAFMITGSWDAESIFQLAKEAGFEVGVIPFPLPGKGEKWGDLIVGRRNEATAWGIGPYGVYKRSRNAEQAIDFLRFLTSQKYNGLFNREAGWPPLTIGAEPKEELKPFQLNPNGYLGRLQFNITPYIEMLWRGQYGRYLSGEISYDEFAALWERDVVQSGAGDRAWGIEYDKRQRECRDQERILAVQAMRMLFDPAARDAPAKYRKVLTQQVTRNNGEDYHQRFREARPGRSIPPPQ